MRTKLRWIVLPALTLACVLATGCASNPKPTPETPTLTTTNPTARPDTNPKIAGPDIREPDSLSESHPRIEADGLIGDVFYDVDKYELRPDARESLAKNAEFMTRKGPDLLFNIEGHCDERGTDEYNIVLGQKRVDIALDFLASLGIDRSRFKAQSFGESRPICAESNETCWQKNRRARFVVSGQR